MVTKFGLGAHWPSGLMGTPDLLPSRFQFLVFTLVTRPKSAASHSITLLPVLTLPHFLISCHKAVQLHYFCCVTLGKSTPKLIFSPLWEMGKVNFPFPSALARILPAFRRGVRLGSGQEPPPHLYTVLLTALTSALGAATWWHWATHTTPRSLCAASVGRSWKRGASLRRRVQSSAPPAMTCATHPAVPSARRRSQA